MERLKHCIRVTYPEHGTVAPVRLPEEEEEDWKARASYILEVHRGVILKGWNSCNICDPRKARG